MSGLASLRLALSAVLLGVSALPSAALLQTAAAQEVVKGPSGLPLPRFVSLKASRVNLRIGPGRNYSVDWMYLKAGLPMEIVQEYDNWRRVRDAEGTEGWINQSLLSGNRTAITAPWQKGKSTLIPLLAEPAESARVVARLEPGVIGAIEACNGQWCEMRVGKYEGWVSQALIWGAYPGERVED